MIRYGYAIRLGGDPEISGALARGIQSGTRTELQRASSEAVRRVAMYQHSPEEWEEMIEEARVLYGGRRYTPRWAERLLVGYAMICLGFWWLYHRQDRLLSKEG